MFIEKQPSASVKPDNQLSFKLGLNGIIIILWTAMRAKFLNKLSLFNINKVVYHLFNWFIREKIAKLPLNNK